MDKTSIPYLQKDRITRQKINKENRRLERQTLQEITHLTYSVQQQQNTLYSQGPGCMFNMTDHTGLQ